MALYRVGSNGKAPAGLSVGDEVVTGGGTYKITGVNADGTYKSEISNKNQTIYNTTNYSTRSNDLLNQGVSDYTKSKVESLESGYTPSATVQAAQSYLSSIQGSKPGVYESKWSSQLDDLYNQIVNRDKFSYDLGTDMLYNQYKEQYQNLGQTAMMDTMGQAAALTGGYGSSYSQSVGQQAYNAYLQQLNDVVPELYGMALDQYNQEGTDLYNQYNLLNSREQADYNAYRDAVDDYYDTWNLAQDAYNDSYQQDYQQYADQLAYWLAKSQEEAAAYAAQQKAESTVQNNTGSTASTKQKTGTTQNNVKTSQKTEENKVTLSTSAQSVADRAEWIATPAQQKEFLKRARSGGTITAAEEKQILARLGLS